MENKIEKADLIDVQKKITDTSNDLAVEINKKYSLDDGLKKSLKPSIAMVLVSSILSAFFPMNLITIILWGITAGVMLPTAIYGVKDIITTKNVVELKRKLKDLTAIQKDMKVDFDIEKKRQKRVSLSITSAEEVSVELEDIKEDIKNDVNNV